MEYCFVTKLMGLKLAGPISGRAYNRYFRVAPVGNWRICCLFIKHSKSNLSCSIHDIMDFTGLVLNSVHCKALYI